MKVIYTISLLFFFTLTARAQEAQKADHGAYFSDFYVMEAKPMQFEINYKWPKTDRVLVRIKDQEQNIIFAEKTLVYKKYHKYFDLSSMADGQYTFELTDGEDTFVRTFLIATKTERAARTL